MSVIACIHVIMRGVERCQSKQTNKQTKQPQKCHNQNLTVCMESLLNDWGSCVFSPGHTRAQVCPMSLTTLPAPPADILIRKTRAKRKNMADRVGGSSQYSLCHSFPNSFLGTPRGACLGFSPKHYITDTYNQVILKL